MKLSVQLMCSLLVMLLFYSPLEAKTTFSFNHPTVDCDPPGMPVVSTITSVSAQLSWAAGDETDLHSYEWLVVASGLAPDPDIATETAATTATVTGLTSNTVYDVYVRTLCGDMTISDWIGPVSFTTAPGCGNTLTDSGGSGANYQNGEKSTTVICPNVAGTVVSLTFSQLALATNDSLLIYDGASISDYLTETLLASSGMPMAPITSTNPDGCLTVKFSSDLQSTAAGWTAAISCAAPAGCTPVQYVNIFNLTSTSAKFSWPAVIGATGYEWELRLATTGELVDFGNTNDPDLLEISDLMEAFAYNFQIRTVCGVGVTSGWFPISFFTPHNCGGSLELMCGGAPTLVSLTGPGIWQTDPCGSQFNATPGREKLYRFTAPHTRKYRLKTFAGTGSGLKPFISYAYKESTLGCGPFNWKCIASVNVNNSLETPMFGPLVAGKEYLILADAETVEFIQQSFQIIGCDAPNDEVRDAILLNLNASCDTSIYSNTGATFNVADSEPDPDFGVTPGVDELEGRWLTAADRTVWFKFKAPTSGTVLVSSGSVPNNATNDPQLALYDFVDTADYKSARLLVSDDDNGSSGLGFNSVFSYSGLDKDSIYYIQVDKFSTSVGPFCITVAENVIRTNEAFCFDKGYFEKDVNGLVPGGDRWYNIYTSPDVLELGDLVMAVKPGMNDLDTVFARVSVSEELPISINQIYHLPAYFDLHTSTVAEEPYTVRLFYKMSEFDSLVKKSDAPSNTRIDDLVVTHYAGPNEDCTQLNNSPLGAVELITQVEAVEIGNSRMFYVEFQTMADGEYGVHLGPIALPVELRSFSGKIVGAANRLEWTTETERNVAWHLIERSENGIEWKEIGRRAGQNNSVFATDYTFEDKQPLPKSFYRIRSLDADGQSALSSIVVLHRRESTLNIERVYPSPAENYVQVDIQAPEEADIVIRVQDITGQIMLEEHVAVPKGTHSTSLSVQSLPAGMYIVSLSDGISVVSPVRIIKN